MIRLILGTRPEAIKLYPVVRVLAQRKRAFEVIGTGQHASLLAGTGLRLHRNLHIPSDNDPEAYVGRVTAALRGLSWQHVTHAVVQGDTASALAGSLAASAHGVRILHVEAGLRSGDLRDPWPEEGFRVRIDQLASIRCCPTEGNLAHLAAEGLSGVVTGNTITDALRLSGLKRSDTPAQMVLVTLHRRESFGAKLRNILTGLAQYAETRPETAFCWPVHPNPEVQAALDDVPMPVNVLRRGPLAYRDFLTFLASAKAVLTDSGGVVEEACTLGIPTVVARHHTERPEAIGVSAQLVGTEAHRVREGLAWALEARVNPSPVFGDGHAAERMVDLL